MSLIDDGYLVAGYTASNDGDVSGNNGGKDIWIIKVDTSGNLMWQKTIGGQEDEEITSMFNGTETGFFLSGKKNGAQWIIRMDPEANILWDKTFGSSSTENFAGKMFEGHYHYYFTGSGKARDGDVADKPTTTEDAWIVKMDGQGNIVWKSYLGGAGADRGIALSGWTGPHIVLFGNTQSSDLFPQLNGTQNIFMAKFNESDGTLVSKKLITNSAWDELNHVQEISSNRYMLVGRTRTGSNEDSYDAFIILTDMEGEVVSADVMGGNGPDEINAIDFGGYGHKIYVGTSSLPDAYGNTGTGGWYGWLQQR